MFGNHYVRDSLGALEKQFESHLGYSAQEYANLNALYFFPNIITPLLAGMVLDKIGVSRSFLYAVVIASLGHLLFALGIQIHSKIIVFIARGLSGSVYEIIDALLPITYLGPLFQNEFQIVVGFMQVFIRFGSVANFIISPILYHEFGLRVAFWFAALVGSSSILLLLGAMNIEKQYVMYLNSQSIKPHGCENKVEVEMVPVDEESETSSLVSQSRDVSPSAKSSGIWDTLSDLLPLHLLPFEYYLWLISGSLTYGAIVPFWFIGSKYLQDYYSQTVMYADTLMTIPEGMVVILGFPLALLSKKFKWNVTQCLYGLSIAQFGMGLSLFLLTLPSILYPPESFSSSLSAISHYFNGTHPYQQNSSFVPSPISDTSSSPTEFSWSLDNLLIHMTPIFCLLLLGISFSFSCSFFWGSITQLVPKELLSQASGVVSCGVNVLPTMILPLLTFLAALLHTPPTVQELGRHPNLSAILATTGNVTIISLGILAFMGTVCSIAAGLVTSNKNKDIDNRETTAISESDYSLVDIKDEDIDIH